MWVTHRLKADQLFTRGERVKPIVSGAHSATIYVKTQSQREKNRLAFSNLGNVFNQCSLFPPTPKTIRTAAVRRYSKYFLILLTGDVEGK